MRIFPATAIFKKLKQTHSVNFTNSDSAEKGILYQWPELFFQSDFRVEHHWRE